MNDNFKNLYYNENNDNLINAFIDMLFISKLLNLKIYLINNVNLKYEDFLIYDLYYYVNIKINNKNITIISSKNNIKELENNNNILKTYKKIYLFLNNNLNLENLNLNNIDIL